MHYWRMLSSFRLLPSPNVARQCFWSICQCDCNALTFGSLEIQSSFLVHWYIFRPSSYINNIASKSRLQEKKGYLCSPVAGNLPSTEKAVLLSDDSGAMGQICIHMQLIPWIRIQWLRISGGSVTSLFHASDNTTSDFPNSKSEL